MGHSDFKKFLLEFDLKPTFFLPEVCILYSMNNYRCPRCSGKMYVDHNYQDEAYCVICGYAAYFERITTKFLPNPFECEEV
jgi:ribosomal protein S27AE